MSRKDACPWCGDEIQDLWEYNLEDGDVKEIECPACDKKISLSLAVSYDYTMKAAGCEKHILKMNENFWFQHAEFCCFECTLCKNEFYDHDFAPPIGKYGNLAEGKYVFTPEARTEMEKLMARRSAYTLSQVEGNT